MRCLPARGAAGLCLAAAVFHAPAQDDPAIPAEEPARQGFSLLGEQVKAGTRRQLRWEGVRQLAGVVQGAPVLVVHGKTDGPTLCLSAAVHGDELNGIEIVRRVVYSLEPDQMAGTVVGVPIVNLAGFQRQSRYLPDRRDLNRRFPGTPNGSLGSRLAYSFFTQIVQHCDQLVDLHTGSFHRTNLPQLRADLRNDKVLEMSRAFGGLAVLHSDGADGTLRKAAVDYGIPAVTVELGEPLRLQVEEVEQGVKGVLTLMNKLGMVKQTRRWAEPQPLFYESNWVRSDRPGIFLASVALGQQVRPGDVLGKVIDPVTNVTRELVAEHRGRILGMALNQSVMPGFAAFRIGIETDEEEVVAIAEDEKPEDEASETDAAETDSADVPEQPVSDAERGASTAGDRDEHDS